MEDYEDDAFTWAPTIIEAVSDDEKASGMTARVWNAEDDFRGPPTQPLSTWEEYTQTLLLTNELSFVD